MNALDQSIVRDCIEGALDAAAGDALTGSVQVTFHLKDGERRQVVISTKRKADKQTTIEVVVKDMQL